jgi:hypothetical protein
VRSAKGKVRTSHLLLVTTVACVHLVHPSHASMSRPCVHLCVRLSVYLPPLHLASILHWHMPFSTSHMSISHVHPTAYRYIPSELIGLEYLRLIISFRWVDAVTHLLLILVTLSVLLCFSSESLYTQYTSVSSMWKYRQVEIAVEASRTRNLIL